MSTETFLALDPSSTATGYAVFKSGKMHEAGLIRPQHKDDAPNDRIATMVQETMDLAREYDIQRIVLEDTSGKVSKRHKGNGAGLATYGKAVGYFLGALKMKGFEVEPVLENTWTAGTKKAGRQMAVAVTYKQYKREDDPGMDISDAISLGEWWLTRKDASC